MLLAWTEDSDEDSSHAAARRCRATHQFTGGHGIRAANSAIEGLYDDVDVLLHELFQPRQTLAH